MKKVRILTKRESQIRVRQIRASQIRASQIRVSQIRATEISSNHRELHGAIFWREMLLNMMKVFDTISFVRALGTKGQTKDDMTKTVNKHVKCHQHFSPEKNPPSYFRLLFGVMSLRTGASLSGGFCSRRKIQPMSDADSSQCLPAAAAKFLVLVGNNKEFLHPEGSIEFKAASINGE